MNLPLRAQGTLLTGIRGCDVAGKDINAIEAGVEQPERRLTAFLRFCVLNPADPREVDIPGAFFQSKGPSKWKGSEISHYPMHWYSHLMHCFEVVAYCHPDADISDEAFSIYQKLVHNLHLTIESKAALIQRLTEDRIANDTVVS